MNIKFLKKKRYLLPIIFILICLGFTLYFRFAVILYPPVVEDNKLVLPTRHQVDSNFYTLDDSWLKKNKYGLWEMMVCGSDIDLGIKNGVLAKDLIEYQEEAFVEFLQKLVPSTFYINFLKYFIAWFNKDIDKHIPSEFQKEIYGVSLSANSKFDFIAPNYHRILNYHAAHDIGHTLQNMNLVACTAFGVKDTLSEDSSLLIGRNMDFYSGDKFAENKIVAFYKPDKGYNFVSITWGGLIGVISGMNDQGLTVTLNAAESEIPHAVKTPVSILARTILQYASNIDEAYAIAKKYETFVAESFLIGSAKDNDMAVIEKSTTAIDLYRRNDDELILTNHFQGDTFKNTALNNEARNESGSGYRWERTEELLNKKEKHNVKSFVDILRDQKGKGGKDIGMGNELAINQLIAHHSVVFKPRQLIMYVSTPPYQLGEYIAYDLNTIFDTNFDCKNLVYNSCLTIEADTFKFSKNYKDFIMFKSKTDSLKAFIKSEDQTPFADEFIVDYCNLNSEYFYAYFMAGQYYEKINQTDKALKYYNLALQKEIPRLAEIEQIRDRIEEIQKR